MDKVRVLVVDDSAVVRQTLSAILESDPQIEVMATAADPYIAAERMKKEVPDVITLDVEMPRMDGLTFLRKLMRQHPIPVVMCSSLTEKGCDTAMSALALGAINIITKPKLGVAGYFEEAKITICDAVKEAAHVRPVRKRAPMMVPGEKLTADAILPLGGAKSMIATTQKIVAVGASTGGTDALETLLMGFQVDCPGMVIVQHMPEKFTASFARRLNDTCPMEVKEAADNESIVAGRVLIAPGNRHTLIKRSGARYYVEVKDGPLVTRHRPSVDVLFRSAARYGGRNVVGVILTGMGDDGARGMNEMKEAGAFNIAQDEKSCVVFGMPAEAIKSGGVDEVLPLKNIAALVTKQCR